MRARERILIALDTSDAEQAVQWVRLLAPYVGGFKVGLELVHAAGFGIFDRLREAGAERIFYDAKLHDIPNTVAQAVRAIARMGVWMVNVHASGGRAMMEAAVVSAHSVPNPPLLVAVTVLTSLSERELQVDLGVRRGVPTQVVKLARLAQEVGMSGVVASAQEAAVLRKQIGQDFLVVTPGIRTADEQTHDQKRVTTPAEAVRAGADYLVIGRSVTADADPLQKVQRVVEQVAKWAEN